MLKSDLPKPFPTYRSLPQEIKNSWFRAFAIQLIRVEVGMPVKRTRRIARMDEGKEISLCRIHEHVKVASSAATNSTNRSSKRGGLGHAVHNNGAKTFERKWDEMIS